MDNTALCYQRLAADTYPRQVKVIQARYEARADKSLREVYCPDEDFLHMEHDIVRFAVRNRKVLIDILGDPGLLSSLVRLFVLSTLEFTFNKNQFIQVNEKGHIALEQIYLTYLQGMKAILIAEDDEASIYQRFEALVAEHFANLRDNLSHYLDNKEDHDLSSQAIFQRAVCEQYSSGFQLDLLGIRPEEMAQPVLDLGCGKSGHLVKYLYQRGTYAFGIDRIVEDSPFLIEGDWLTAGLSPDTWGTVISHMAFSNHFSFHHLYRSGNPQAYAKQ